ncbi:MAG: hypothetical protein GY943_21275 [Chloroflexi bacterium]|nr:hypothetical protein [Chloroflexota bacterium]
MTRATFIPFAGNQATYLPTNSYKAVTNLQQMIDKKQVIRVMKPALVEQIQTAVSQRKSLPNILHFNGNFYISLQAIRDEAHREHVFSLLRQAQIDDSIDLSSVPRTILQILQPALPKPSPLAGSIALSLIISIICGALIMAIGVLIMTVSGTALEGAFGLQKTAIIFIIATVICWFISTGIIFAKVKLAKAA